MSDEPLTREELWADAGRKSISGKEFLAEDAWLPARKVLALIDERDALKLTGDAMQNFNKGLLEIVQAEALHWKRVAMAEAGFSADVIACLTAPMPPLTPEDMSIAQQLAHQWAERHGLKP